MIPRFAMTEGALSAEAVASMREALLSSPLLGPSVLLRGFAPTRGFAALFRRDGAPRLAERVPTLAPFLALAIEDDASNAYYLNVLCVPEGSGVGAHVDGTLTSACGLERAAPRRVSVLYLAVPERGGALRLHRRFGPATSIAPKLGAMLRFRGDLVHAVDPVERGTRMSVVLEEYVLPESSLSAVPRFELVSDGYFERLLASARERMG